MPECPSCKTPYQPDDRYCNQCGKRIGQEQVMQSGALTQKSLDLVDVHFNLGLVYFKKGDFAKAISTWEKALQRDPGNELLQEHIDEAKAKLES